MSHGSVPEPSRSLRENFARAMRERLSSDSQGISAELTPTGIRLTGRVKSFYHKQIAQESLRHLAAGPIENALEVVRN